MRISDWSSDVCSSNDLVYMTTKLEGGDTVFLPFNQGNEGHEGNPPSGTGSSTNYLWREILARPMFMRILKDFALFEPGKSGRRDEIGRASGRESVCKSG